jgi:hypothetical protein
MNDPINPIEPPRPASLHPTEPPRPRLKSGSDILGALTESLGPLPQLGDGLVTTDTTTPVPPSLLVLVGEVGLGGGNEGSKSLLVLGSDVLEGDDGGGLLVDDRTETSLVLDDDVWNAHLEGD